MANFTTLIVDMIKKERLFAPQGGPIILAQVFPISFSFNIKTTRIYMFNHL